jgi:dTDP-4-amino-4,6-dideoxygalactose transaminase
VSTRIGLVDLRRRHAAVAEEVEVRVLRVLRSGRYVGGAEVTELEAAVAAHMGSAQAIGVGSGTLALQLALSAVGVTAGDEVIVPGLSFFATAGAVLALGAIPVVVDVLEHAPLMDPAQAQEAATDQTRAVVPVHLFGMTAELPQIDRPIVVDAAQAMGADPSPPLGTAAALSFYPSKVLGAIGDAGMVLTSSPSVAERVRLLANHGGPAHTLPGTNSRLDAVQAAALLAHLEVLEHRVAKRRAFAARLDASAGGRAVQRDSGSPVAVWAMRHPRRDGLAAACEAAGIEARVYYPAPLSDAPAMAGRARVNSTLPNARAFASETLALPCHADLTESELARICAVLEAWA